MMRNDAKTCICLLAGVAVLACSRGHKIERSDGNTTVILTADVYPLVLGRNQLTLEVADANGESVPAGAAIEVRYGLPPMPGMGAVSNIVVPTRNGGRYAFVAEIHTRAKWTFDVLVRRNGRPDTVLAFVLDAP